MLAPLIEVVTRLAKSWLREKSLGSPVSTKVMKNLSKCLDKYLFSLNYEHKFIYPCLFQASMQV
jgi:hypothetical protein